MILCFFPSLSSSYLPIYLSSSLLTLLWQASDYYIKEYWFSVPSFSPTDVATGSPTGHFQGICGRWDEPGVKAETLPALRDLLCFTFVLL